MDDLPSEYDIIIIGTGLTESIIAAAASRVGKTVLHLDSNDYYGGDWASFNLDNLQNYLNKEVTPHEVNCVHPAHEHELKNANNIYNIEQVWHIEDDIEYKWTKSQILKEYRRFNIDLTPRLLFFKGQLIQLLITSNISRYAEFRSATRVLTVLPCDSENPEEKKFKLSTVPCSRSDVFASKDITVFEKRMLMKISQSCISYNPNEDNAEFKDFINKRFLEYLEHKKLTKNLIHYVLYAIAMGNSETECLEGVLRTNRFLSSLGHYGNTPFLYPMYGNGEISQYFCRLCAVFGGTYCLKRPVTKIITEDKSDDNIIKEKHTDYKEINKRYKEIVCANQHLKSQHLVMGAGFVPQKFVKEKTSAGLSRAVFITDCSILEDGHESLALLKIPPIDGFSKLEIIVLEVGKSCYVCPDGLYLVHMTCQQDIDARADLQPLAEKLFEMNPKFEKIVVESSDNQNEDNVEKTDEDKVTDDMKDSKKDSDKKQDRPNCLWSLYFNLKDTSKCNFAEWDVPENVFLCSGPDLDLDYDHAVEEARATFAKIYPDCEFLPRAPDPEEIVFGESDDNEDALKKNENEEQIDAANSGGDQKVIDEKELNDVQDIKDENSDLIDSIQECSLEKKTEDTKNIENIDVK